RSFTSPENAQFQKCSTCVSTLRFLVMLQHPLRGTGIQLQHRGSIIGASQLNSATCETTQVRAPHPRKPKTGFFLLLCLLRTVRCSSELLMKLLRNSLLIFSTALLGILFFSCQGSDNGSLQR